MTPHPMNQGVEAPAGFLADKLFTMTLRSSPCSAAGKGSTRAGLMASPCLARR